MVDKESLKRHLRTLGQRGIEPPGPTLMQRIKDGIPARLVPHRMDTVSIIVDLRISRMGAAAAIIVALVLAGGFFAAREGLNASLVEDGKLFLKYKLGGEKALSRLTPESLMALRDSLLAQGREVVCYSENLDDTDPFTILMYWRVDDDEYGVVMGDLSVRTVRAKALIRLQTYMLQSELE